MSRRCVWFGRPPRKVYIFFAEVSKVGFCWQWVSERGLCQRFVSPSGAIQRNTRSTDSMGHVVVSAQDMQLLLIVRRKIRTTSAALLCENCTSVITHCLLYAVRTRAHTVSNSAKIGKAWAMYRSIASWTPRVGRLGRAGPTRTRVVRSRGQTKDIHTYSYIQV